MMNNGFNDWNHEAGNHDVSTRSAANVAKTIDPCSSIAQNNTAAKNNGMYEITRERSSLLTLADVIINVKYPIGNKIATIVNKLTKFCNCVQPIKTINTITKAKATTPKMIFVTKGLTSSGCNGSGAYNESFDKCLPPKWNWIKPKNIPMAANENAKWKPACSCVQPTNNGAINEPRLIPKTKIEKPASRAESPSL